MSETADLIRTFYEREDCAVGGPLHVVLDDFNLEDEWLHTMPHGESSETVAAAEEIVRHLQPMSLPERAATVGLAHGYRWDGEAWR